MLEFLTQELSNNFFYSNLNTEIGNLTNFPQWDRELFYSQALLQGCCGNQTAKRSRYDYVSDSTSVIARLYSIYSYNSILLKIIRKLVFLLSERVIGLKLLFYKDVANTLSKWEADNPYLGSITSTPGRCQFFFCFSWFDNHKNSYIVLWSST